MSNINVNISFWNEKWKKIRLSKINKSEHYEISNYGRIRRYHPDKKEYRISKDHKFVIHLDFVKDNNHCQNLEWVTHEEMYAHHKNNPNYKKGVVRNSKLTETDVIRLKKKLGRNKNKLYKIAREFGITHTQLNRIRSGENWGHINSEDN
jgi:hypothetical protein